MRATFLTVVTTVILMLIGGTVAVAQSADLARPGSATIEIVRMELVSPGIIEADGSGPAYVEHGRTIDMTWVASDPRLSGEARCTGDRHINPDGSGFVTETFVIVNDTGRWVGTSTGLRVARPPDFVIGSGLLPPGPGYQEFVLFEGEGAYDGLTAVVDIDASGGMPVVDGIVFQGALPTAPELAVG